MSVRFALSTATLPPLEPLPRAALPPGTVPLARHLLGKVLVRDLHGTTLAGASSKPRRTSRTTRRATPFAA